VKKSRKSKALLVIAIITLIFAGIPVVLRAVLLTPSVAGKIKNEVRKQVEDALDIPLEMGDMYIDLFGRVVVNKVRFGEGSEALFSAESLKIHISLTELLKKSGHPADLVKYIVVDSPETHVIRREDGSWNFDRLLGNTAGASDAGLPQFTIFLRNGLAIYEDHYPDPYPIDRLRVVNFDGRVFLEHEKVMRIELDAPETSYARSLRMEMKYDFRAGWRLDATMRDVDMSPVNAFFSEDTLEMTGKAERLELYVEAAFTKIGSPPVFSWGGTSVVSGARVAFPAYDLRLDDVNTKAEFSSNMINIERGTARIGNGGVQFSMSLFVRERPGILLSADFSGVPVESLAPAAGIRDNPPRGSVSGSLSATGYADNPAVITSFSIRDASYRDFRAERIQCEASFNNNIVTIENADISAAGGHVHGGGVLKISPDSPVEYAFAGELSALDLETALRSAGVEPGEPVSGILDGRLLVRGTTESPGAFGTFEASRLSFHEIEQGRASAAFTYRDGQADIESFVLEGDEEKVVASGRITGGGELEMQISAARGRMSTLLHLAGRDDLESGGIVNVRGSLTGSLESPEFSGLVEGRDIAISSFRCDRVSGGVGFQENVLELVDISIFSGPDRHDLSGFIDFEDETLELDVLMQGISLGSLAHLAKDALKLDIEIPEGFDGVLDASGMLSGTFEEPRGILQLVARDVTLYGERIDSIDTSLYYSEALKVAEAEVTLPAGRVSVTGALDPEAMDISFTGESIDIGRFNAASDFAASGTVRVSGSLSGSLDSPSLEAHISSDRILYRGTEFSIKESTIAYHEGLFTVDHLPVSRNDERYIVDASYHFDTSTMDLGVELDNAALATLAGFLPYSIPGGTSGSLNGSCTIHSEEDNYSGNFHLGGESLTIGTYPLEALVLDGKFQDEIIEIEKFEAQNDLLFAQASGKLDMARKSDSRMNISAYSVELSRLSEMELAAVPMGGLADIEIQLINEDGRQVTIGSIEAYDPSVFGVEFDRARGQFRFDGDIFTLTDLQLLKGTERLSLRADIPVREGFEDRFSIEPSADEFGLAVLNPLLDPMGIHLDGSVSFGALKVTGTMKKPRYSGSVRLNDAVLRHRDLGQDISDISGTLTFKDNILSGDGITASFGKHPVSASASITFSGLAPHTYGLMLDDIRSMPVIYANIYNGMVDITNFGIRRTPEQFVIAGRAGGPPPSVNLHHGTITLPQLAAGEEPGAPPPPVSFGRRNLNITVADNIVVRNAGNNLRLEPSGSIELAGTMLNPEIKGWLVSDRGHIRYFGNTFKMVDDTVIGFYSFKGVGVIPIFYAQARAWIGGTDVSLEISGPMVDIDEFPAYRELCSESAGIISAEGGGMGAPRMALGRDGEIVVPVCPQVDLTAYDNMTGAPLSTQEIMQKLTHTEGLIQGEDTAQALRSEAFSIFTPYVGSIVERGVDLENFSINLDPNEDVLVQLEKNFDNKFYLMYERLFSDDVEYQLELRYKFRKRSFLKWGIDQDNETDYQVEYRLRF